MDDIDAVSPMDRRRMLQGAASASAAGLLAPAVARAAPGPADLVIRNGRVLLLDPKFRQAEAIAVRGGVVLAIGTDREIKRHIGQRTREIDAGGGTVLPGINDTHLHLNTVGLNAYSIDVDKRRIEDVVTAVRTAAQQAPAPDPWIRGQGWAELVLPRVPTIADLDPVSGAHPVVLRDFSGHAMVVNSVVLKMAGVTRDTQAPVGGVIDRDARGEPTGVLRETAMRLVQSIIPRFTPDEIGRAIDAAIKIMHARGVTSCTEPGIDRRTFDIYADKARAGALPMRVTALLSAIGGGPDTLREILGAFQAPAGVDPRILRAIGVKIGADGIPRFRTAWMHKPYLDGSNGSMTVAGATIEEQVATLHRMFQVAADAGFQVGTHSCGDAATDAVVDGYVKIIQRAGPRSELRHCVHHCNFPSMQTLQTMARHGIGANLNGEILHLQGRVLEPVIGTELTERQWPYRSALNAGVRVTSGSDAPVVADNHWLRGVLASVLREGLDGSRVGEAERITVPEALATYTSTGAWQDRAESWKGTLEAGKVADICIVDGDLVKDDPRSFLRMQVTTTVVGGQVVYEKPKGGLAMRPFGGGRGDHACRNTAMCCCQLAEQLSA